MNYLISYEIFFNNQIVGKAVENTEADSVTDALEKMRTERGNELLKTINKDKITKGEKLWDLKAVLLVPTFIFSEESNGKTTKSS